MHDTKKTHKIVSAERFLARPTHLHGTLEVQVLQAGGVRQAVDHCSVLLRAAAQHQRRGSPAVRLHTIPES